MRKALLFAVLLLSSSAFAQSGDVSWGPWKFTWEVADGAGLALRYVTFNGRHVAAKMSLPAIRVKYALDEWQGGCGPYLDQISWDKIEHISNCGGKVCSIESTVGGTKWFQLAIFARIGSYDLSQMWYLSDKGDIRPRLSSRGLQCTFDHDHHVYWRFDFDVDGAWSDQVFIFDKSFSDTGWGAGFKQLFTEPNMLRKPEQSRFWYVRDATSTSGLWLFPGDNDGTADAFSNKAVAVRLYRGNEAGAWAFGPLGHLGYKNGEETASKDSVVWYVGHIHHDAAGGADEYHTVGPNIVLNY